MRQKIDTLFVGTRYLIRRNPPCVHTAFPTIGAMDDPIPGHSRDCFEVRCVAVCLKPQASILKPINVQPSTLTPQPSALSTLNIQPSTFSLNLQPSILTPQPSALSTLTIQPSTLSLFVRQSAGVRAGTPGLAAFADDANLTIPDANLTGAVKSGAGPPEGEDETKGKMLKDEGNALVVAPTLDEG